MKENAGWNLLFASLMVVSIYWGLNGVSDQNAPVPKAAPSQESSGTMPDDSLFGQIGPEKGTALVRMVLSQIGPGKTMEEEVIRQKVGAAAESLQLSLSGDHIEALTFYVMGQLPDLRAGDRSTAGNASSPAGRGVVLRLLDQIDRWVNRIRSFFVPEGPLETTGFELPRGFRNGIMC